MAFRLSLLDFNDWPRTKGWPWYKLDSRAVETLRANRAIVELDGTNFHRWRAGQLTPWLRPDVVFDTNAQGCSVPVLPEGPVA